MMWPGITRLRRSSAPGAGSFMANVVDDMSADPAPGLLEPECTSVEPLGPAEPPEGSSAARRSAARAKPQPRPPAAAEPVAKLDRRSSRTRREAAAPDGRAPAAGSQPIRTATPADASAARAAVLRQGLPRAGTYRTSTVTRSLHPTPVATPIVTMTTA